ncbi:HAD-IA family hydrolase [Streptomyces albulus]|nr:HAD-IA family hydrolase [Streptomyces noursei]
MTGTPLRAALLDLEGTLYANERVIEGAAAAIGALREQGVALRFLTNTDSRTTAQIHARLTGYGLPVRPEELFTPVVAARHLLTAPGSAPTPWCRAPCATGARPGVRTAVHARADRRLPRRAGLPGAGRRVPGRAGGAELLALQRGRYFKRADGDHLDTGAVVAAVEYAAGTTAQVLGKPAVDFFALAVRSLGVSAEECLVVGDDASTDVAGGNAAGLRTVQVRTGKYADQHAEGLTGAATHTCDSIAELPDLIAKLGER